MRLAAPPAEQPTPAAPVAAIKGGSDGLRIAVRTTDAGAAEQDLRAQMERKGAGLLRGAGAVLELPGETVDGELVARVAAVCAEYGLALTGVQTQPRASARPRPVRVELPGDGAFFAMGTLRAGQRISHDGPVVVLGDVNPGAEVRAGGSVVVWGRLRGTVEAGLSGRGVSVICALDLAPTQLRIGDARARAPEAAPTRPGPEWARAENGAIVVERWE